MQRRKKENPGIILLQEFISDGPSDYHIYVPKNKEERSNEVCIMLKKDTFEEGKLIVLKDLPRVTFVQTKHKITKETFVFCFFHASTYSNLYHDNILKRIDDVLNKQSSLFSEFINEDEFYLVCGGDTNRLYYNSKKSIITTLNKNHELKDCCIIVFGLVSLDQ